ncbi:50S ribosomal protein L29 [Mesomycoplasma conjunctivae]|uniref:Large ribosomal subunit protein uL29 n=1 Tax=Mesomycoplasma conjunctivae (strain ATCC 25834 / NCTC 10147 / HRC/581) TaxID=572263 RepID=C5J5U0_MESCH|nr:50S ribosomal protein L29 [Mesomycoplasma conjunctivae]CAT04829.1 50S ribosomal protein L29 [Mesomycoplasma conjunctivae]VEU65873.1 50S ribosomal protein L29 [Mesomycoplasma conjunctivae]
MEFKELRAKSATELKQMLIEYRSELFTLRFKNKTQQLDQSHKIADIKKDIARILTALKQLELSKEGSN